MTNKNPEADYSQLSIAFNFALDMRLRALIHTGIPGIITKYDRATRRAEVQPALQIRLTDGTLKSRAPLCDVPVLWPGGGGFVIHAPLVAGDPVWLMFSQRGITQFKKSFAESTPDIEAYFAEKDGVAIPSLGARNITPAGGEGNLVLQTNNGEAYVEIGEDKSIRASKDGTSLIEIGADNALRMSKDGTSLIEIGADNALRMSKDGTSLIEIGADNALRMSKDGTSLIEIGADNSINITKTDPNGQNVVASISTANMITLRINDGDGAFRRFNMTASSIVMDIDGPGGSGAPTELQLRAGRLNIRGNLSIIGNITSTGTFTNNGVQVGSTHTHIGNQGSPTGTPQ